MPLTAENLLFIRALHAHADRLRELSGAEWPAIHDQLAELLGELEHAESSLQARMILDRIIRVGLSSPARDLVRGLLRQAMAEAGRLESAGGFIPMIDPTSGQSREIDAGPVLSDAQVSQADVAAAGRGLAEKLRSDDPASTPQTPYLNTRFDGIGPQQPLPVGQRVRLIVWVGAQIDTDRGQSSRPFEFSFPDASTPISFTVRVHADPDAWTIEPAQPTMIVQPPGITGQEAVFLVTARQTGHDKLYISVERGDTGAIVQHVWLPVEAADDKNQHLRPTTSEIGTIDQAPLAVNLPMDDKDLAGRTVHMTIQPGRDSESFQLSVQAALPSGQFYDIYTVPLNATAIQNATLRLRQELQKIVFYEVSAGGRRTYPFADAAALIVDEQVARRAIVPLADAGRQVWGMLFHAPRGPAALGQFADALRDLPHGSTLQIVIGSQQLIVPWALLYDKPGPVTSETLDWAGFWGYRYVLDVLPPGQYPRPTIEDAPPGVQLFFNDDAALHAFTTAQEAYVRDQLRGVRAQVARGIEAVRDTLAGSLDAALLYLYCHGTHASGLVQAGALPGDSALYFSNHEQIRLIDLKELVSSPLAGSPLVFLNACEGATQDAFYYDGFMPFFIEERGARGFIGTEVKAPQLLAHHFALDFLGAFAQGEQVGTILWRLRRFYLDRYHTILAFNYSLYGLDEIQLATPKE